MYSQYLYLQLPLMRHHLI